MLAHHRHTKPLPARRVKCAVHKLAYSERGEPWGALITVVVLEPR